MAYSRGEKRDVALGRVGKTLRQRTPQKGGQVERGGVATQLPMHIASPLAKPLARLSRQGLFRYAGFPEALQEHITVGEIGEVST
jgi:hypothetical protein